MERNQVATSSGIGWRIAAELGGDIKRNTQEKQKFKYSYSSIGAMGGVFFYIFEKL